VSAWYATGWRIKSIDAGASSINVDDVKISKDQQGDSSVVNIITINMNGRRIK